MGTTGDAGGSVKDFFALGDNIIVALRIAIQFGKGEALIGSKFVNKELSDVKICTPGKFGKYKLAC